MSTLSDEDVILEEIMSIVNQQDVILEEIMSIVNQRDVIVEVNPHVVGDYIDNDWSGDELWYELPDLPDDHMIWGDTQCLILKHLILVCEMPGLIE